VIKKSRVNLYVGPKPGTLLRWYTQQVLRIRPYLLANCRHLLRKPLDAVRKIRIPVSRVCSPIDGIVVNLLSGMRTPLIDVPCLPRHDRCQVLRRKWAGFGQQTVLARDKIFDPRAALAEVAGVAVLGFRKNFWLVVAALIGHRALRRHVWAIVSKPPGQVEPSGHLMG